MERNLHRVVVATAARGVRHTIALLSAFPDILDFGALAPVHRLVTRPNDPRLVLMLRALIERVRPTVIHARNWGAWPDVAVARLTVRPRPRLVFSYHGVEEDGPVPLSRRLAFQGLARVTDDVLAVSGAARDLLARRFGLDPARVGVLANGVDTSRFAPSPRPESTRLVLGSAGRLHAVKRFPWVLTAAADLVAAGVDVEVRFAGDGPELELLRAEAARLGLAERTRFAGHVDDVAAFLRELDVFVLPSALEASPNALLEAMATGLACVASAVGGIPEVTDGGRAARLFEADDRAGLSAALRDLALDAAQRRALGRRARAWVEAHHGHDAMMARYLDLYLRDARSPSPEDTR